jgi:hypothetical protein
VMRQIGFSLQRACTLHREVVAVVTRVVGVWSWC